MRRPATNLIYAAIYDGRFFFTCGKMCHSCAANGARCAPYAGIAVYFLVNAKALISAAVGIVAIAPIIRTFHSWGSSFRICFKNGMVNLRLAANDARSSFLSSIHNEDKSLS